MKDARLTTGRYGAVRYEHHPRAQPTMLRSTSRLAWLRFTRARHGECFVLRPTHPRLPREPGRQL